MKSKKPQTVHYRRKREQRTNYNKRRRLLLSQGNRLVVRFTGSKIIAQVVSFTPLGDKVLVGVDSSSLAKQGWNYSLKNTPAAYLTGFMLGKTAVKNFLPMQSGDVPVTHADVSHLEQVIGYKPATPVKEGIKKFVEWYKGYDHV